MTKPLFFDLDGCLTNSAPGITQSIAESLRMKGKDVHPDDFLSYVGPPLLDSYRQDFPDLDEYELLKLYRQIYKAGQIFNAKVYPGIRELLKKLNEDGYDLYLVTSKGEEQAEMILEHFDLMKYFKNVFGANEDESRSSKEQMIEYAFETLKSHEGIMIGDRKFDVEGAKANSIESIGDLWGFGSKEELKEAGADYIVSTPEELYTLIRTINPVLQQ